MWSGRCNFAKKTLTLKERLDSLIELGQYLREGADDALQAVNQRAYEENRWFTEGNIRTALEALASLLEKPALTAWASAYPCERAPGTDKTVGLVMAGNIPLVGFHDWLSVFVAGHRSKVKLSEKDKRLLPFLIHKMGEWAPESEGYTYFLPDGDVMGAMDAVIATGSNNTARYFEAYFKKYPHIIRKNRNGVAVIDGSETPEELHLLGKDIFTYFGLGCRNVSKIYIPADYDPNTLLEGLRAWRDMAYHDKYKNNFDYGFTLFILNQTPFLYNECLLLREDPSLHARIASVHLERYTSASGLESRLREEWDDIQVLVANKPVSGLPTVGFGQSQRPGLFDYADGVDTLAFLTRL